MATPLYYLDNMARFHNIGQPVPAAPAGASPLNMMPVLNAGVASTSATPSRQVNIIASGPETLRELRAQDKDDRADERASSAARLGGIATILFSGGLAWVLRQYKNNQAELKRAQEFKSAGLPQLPLLRRQELAPIVNKHIEVVEAKVFNSRNIVILTVAALASAISAFAGGMLSMPALITASIVAGVVTAALALFAIVWHCTDNTSLPPEMKQKIETLRTTMRLESPN